MIIEILALFILTCIIAFLFYCKSESFKPELLIVSVCTWAMASMILAGISYVSMTDTEILNSQVTSKERKTVSCSHDYKCNCRIVKKKSSDGKTYEEEVCDTCYEHRNDYNWVLHTGLGDIRIDRIDRQGIHEPPRFTTAKPGDPVAKTHTYVNYIKADENQLLNESTNTLAIEAYKGKLPSYPLNIYDYHYLNRVIAQGVSVPDLDKWNLAVANMLRTLGPSYQVNTVLVFTSEQNMSYAKALRASWLGGKKNDVVVVVGISQWPQISWVDVFSWSEKEMFKVNIRENISELQNIDQQKVISIISSEISKGYIRAPMRDKKYMVTDRTSDPVTLLIVTLLMIFFQVGTFIHFRK